MTILWKLFITFIKIGLFSIGGGYAIIPMIQEQVVEQNHWIDPGIFTDIITISQMTPGPLAVNTSTFVGLQLAGIPGAVAATAGCVLCGVLFSLTLYRFFTGHRESAYVLGILNGLKSASLGLIISAACTILLLAFFGTDTPVKGSVINMTAVFLFAVSLLALRKWKPNPVLILLFSGIIGLICYL